MNKYQYYRSIKASKIGLLPYDSYSYSIRASGILEEYMLSNIPVIVPKNTWMSYFLTIHNGGGCIYNEDIENDFNVKVQTLLNNYENEKVKAIQASQKVYSVRNLSYAIKKIEYLYEHRTVTNIDKHLLKHKYLKIINKGKAEYFTRVAEQYLIENNTDMTHKYLNLSLGVDSLYWKTKALISLINDQKKNQFSLNAIKEVCFYNPQVAIEYINKLDLSNLSDKIKKQIAGFIKINNIENYLTYSDINRYYKLIPITFFNRILTQKKNRNNKFLLFLYYTALIYLKYNKQEISFKYFDLYIKQYDRKTKNKQWLYFINKSYQFINEQCSKHLSLIKRNNYLKKELNFLINKRTKNDIDIYRIASLYKKLKKYDLSIQWFKKSCQNQDENVNLKANIYFHLGEIYFMKNKLKLALKNLKKCINLNREHLSGNQLIEKLNTSKK